MGSYSEIGLFRDSQVKTRLLVSILIQYDGCIGKGTLAYGGGHVGEGRDAEDTVQRRLE